MYFLVDRGFPSELADTRSSVVDSHEPERTALHISPFYDGRYVAKRHRSRSNETV